MKEIVCAFCGKKSVRSTGHVNRANKIGARLFCNRECSGLGRRVERAETEKKEIKRLYDIQYRQKNLKKIKAYKSAAFKKEYAANPEKYRAIRKARSANHSEYCRKPEYKKKKHAYDRKRYAKDAFGDFWEIHVIAMDVRDEALKQMPKIEIMQTKGTNNKTQNRKREYEKVKRG